MRRDVVGKCIPLPWSVSLMCKSVTRVKRPITSVNPKGG